MMKKIAVPKTSIQKNRKIIGLHIRTYREKKGYSQDCLATMMGIHRSTISKVERGKFSITIDYLIKFGWFLDFELSVIDKKL